MPNTNAHRTVRAVCDGRAAGAQEELFGAMHIKRALRPSGDGPGIALEPRVLPAFESAHSGAYRSVVAACSIGLDASVVSRHARRLTRRRFAVSLPDPTNGRASVRSGGATGEAPSALHRQTLARVTACPKPAQRNELVRLLRLVSQATTLTDDQGEKAAARK